MAIEVKAPNSYLMLHRLSVFMGGVIDQGKIYPWASKIVDALNMYDDVLLMNPRREQWDANWEQSLNNPEFVEQVFWELEAQELANIIIYVFAPDAESAYGCLAPITLMELGAYKDKDVLVLCPKGYWRKGNVDIFCLRYDIPVFETMEELVDALLQKVTALKH